MASGPHTFVTLSVFSPDRFQGNRLAIVAVRGNSLTHERKALIAKEFGYSETVFIHDAPSPTMPRRIEIFTETGEEIPFAGHPIIGVGHYIFKYCETAPSYGPQDASKQSTTSIMTKAGPVVINFNGYRQVAACSVPQTLHVHKATVPMSKIVDIQPQIQIVPTYEKCKDKSFPVVSLVKGMTFALVDLSDAPELLGALRPGPAAEVELDEDWNTGFVGTLYYRLVQSLEQTGEPTINAIQARSISHDIEDPGTGSACSALACYLATLPMDTSHKVKDDELTPDKLAEQTSKVKLDDRKADSKGTSKVERKVYAIKQGVEMGRTCTIAVELDLATDEEGKKELKNVILSGRANFFSQGELMK